MWYDSVLQTDGSLQWQSCLNEKNFKFFNVCDSFFTDYHWQPDYLVKTMNTFVEQCPDKSLFNIYVGNDCYGRGTYGGGKYNIYKALEEIR